ncbi:MAG TPA: hypothetical protein VH371_00715 [Candidatus Limnocylindrales bacterium]
MHPDDERLAQTVRLIRHRLGLTQVQLASAAAVPLNDIKAIEGSRAGGVALERLRRVMEAQGGRARLVTWWNGAAADRLLDERHAALVESCVSVFRARGWRADVEVSFSEFGERGSIDVLATNEAFRAVAVCEVKSVFGSLEETNRTLDAKERLAPTIVWRRLGWRPSIVGRLLILPRTTAARNVIAAHSATMASIYPARGREVRTWLREPSGSVRAIWLVSDGPHPSTVSADRR